MCYAHKVILQLKFRYTKAHPFKHNSKQKSQNFYSILANKQKLSNDIFEANIVSLK